jgi:hypothetical protein
VTDTVSNTASGVTDTVSNTASGVTDTVSNTASGVTDTVNGTFGVTDAVSGGSFGSVLSEGASLTGDAAAWSYEGAVWSGTSFSSTAATRERSSSGTTGMALRGPVGAESSQGERVACDPDSTTCIPTADTSPLSNAVGRILGFLAQTGLALLRWMALAVGLSLIGGVILRISRQRRGDPVQNLG